MKIEKMRVLRILNNVYEKPGEKLAQCEMGKQCVKLIPEGLYPYNDYRRTIGEA
jgi:hypothetical protein